MEPQHVDTKMEWNALGDLMTVTRSRWAPSPLWGEGWGEGVRPRASGSSQSPWLFPNGNRNCSMPMSDVSRSCLTSATVRIEMRRFELHCETVPPHPNSLPKGERESTEFACRLSPQIKE